MSGATEELHATVARRLRGARQRYTGQRRALVDVLVGAGRPLTIAEVLERGADLPQSSTYRNLQLLEQVGAVRRIVTANEAAGRYELAEDLTSHHHHLVCRACGAVEDFELSPTAETAIATATDDAGEAGFATEHHRLELIGICADCH